MSNEKRDLSELLLTDDGKWWEFLDDQYQVKHLERPHVGEDVMDWSSTHRVRERSGPVGFDFHERCAHCTQPLPPDLTFCFHCGGPPDRATFPQPFTIVISELESERSAEVGAELLASAGAFSEGEAISIMKQLPAAFFVRAPNKQLVAFCGRLSDVGVYARAYTKDRAPVSWFRETLESLVRNRFRLFATIFGFVAFVIAGAYFPLAFALAFVFVAAMLWLEAQTYKHRYQINVTTALNHTSGFGDGNADRARQIAAGLRHTKVKKNYTIALMEYYALHNSVRTFRLEYGSMLDHVFTDLESLMSGLYALAEKAVDLERLPSVDQLKYTRAQAAASGATAQIATLDQRIETSQRAEEMLDQIGDRIQHLALSLESLRARVATVGKPDQHEIEFEQILAELDAELELFEDVRAEVSSIAAF